MEFSAGHTGREQQIVDLCATTFAASEGAEEGERVRTLVTGLLGMVPQQDVVVLCAQEGSTLLGCLAASRLRYDEDDRTVVVVAPVAVRTDRQGEGIGQQLLRYGRTAWDGFLKAAREIADAGTFTRFEHLPDVDAILGR